VSSKYPNACEDMASFAIPGKVRVELGWIGEGRDGDYREGDPSDYPHLRFDTYDLTKHPMTADDLTMCTGWDCCRSGQDASYCTALSAALPKEVLESVCRHIAERIADASHWKRILEELSWLSDEDARGIHQKLREVPR